MNRTHPIQQTARIALPLIAAAAAVALTGCNSIHDAWAVTYEITADGDTAAPLASVSYVGADKRGDSSETHQADPGATAPWSIEMLVKATDDAMVTATPDGDVALTCRVLLDGTREIASQTAAPGAPVTCEVTTPAFGD